MVSLLPLEYLALNDAAIERFSFECQKVIGFAFAFGFHAT